MARIDLSTVENYSNMTPEEKVAYFEALEIPEPQAKDDSAEMAKLKAALSKANSEAAEYKRQWREKQTEAERADAERAEADKALQEELASLRRDKVVGEYTKQCMGLGYTADLASECAVAMADGRFNDVFSIQQRFLDAQKKEIEAAALNRHSGLTPGAPPVNAAEKAETNEMRAIFGLRPIT